jgi:DNA modification methylase
MKNGPLTFHTGPDLDNYRHQKGGNKLARTKKSIMGDNIFGDGIKQQKHGKLSERFEFPPFSIFNAREGLWQERKRAWLSLGIQSEVGRGGNLLKFSEQATISVGGKAAPPKSYQKQGIGCTFGQASLNKIMRDAKNGLGAIATNVEANDPQYYQQKKDKEKELGRELTKEEFLKNYYISKEDRKQKNFVNGVLMTSDSGNDPKYYIKKQEKEKELGRELTTEEFQRDYYEGPESYSSGTSIFDPVLCELMDTWFCSQTGGMILDPFAGGSVRGIVAGYLGYRYHGIDLSERQIEANYQQKKDIIPDADIEWICGDALEKLDDAPEADFVLSCPPYGSLERYSDDPKDLSTMSYVDFIKTYRRIIFKMSEKLKDGGLACFVVGDYRDPKTGSYVGFVADTIKSFQSCGMTLYNDAILITAVGSLPIRAGKQFSSTRKLGKTHQNILVFLKGSFKKLT